MGSFPVIFLLAEEGKRLGKDWGMHGGCRYSRRVRRLRPFAAVSHVHLQQLQLPFHELEDCLGQ